MTLILTALCKNGACVCADKRNLTWTDGVLDKTEDSFNKIYQFSNIPLIIFNHGVNKFNNKQWNILCAEYEKSNRWKNYDLYEISEDFKEFVENEIAMELKRNIHNGLLQCITAAFDLCGKTNRNINFKMYELFWSYSSNGLKLERPLLGNLILSGEGKKYLKDYLEKNGNFNKDKYWKNLDITQAESELKRLFSIAVKELKCSGGDEFSNEFDIVSITD